MPYRKCPVCGEDMRSRGADVMRVFRQSAGRAEWMFYVDRQVIHRCSDLSGRDGGSEEAALPTPSGS